jgi:hypothetical protein
MRRIITTAAAIATGAAAIALTAAHVAASMLAAVPYTTWYHG